MLQPPRGPAPHHRSPRQELLQQSGTRCCRRLRQKKKKQVLSRSRRWKQELWGCHSHRLRLELRLGRCRQGNRRSRCSRRSVPGLAGTLAGGSLSLPGGEVGCVKQTISSQSDGYRQLRCLLDLRQDEPISQNPPEIACHPDDQPTCHNLHCLCREKSQRRVRHVPASKSFIKPLEGLRASCHLPEGLVSWLNLPTSSLGHRQQSAEGQNPAHLASTLRAPLAP